MAIIAYNMGLSQGKRVIQNPVSQNFSEKFTTIKNIVDANFVFPVNSSTLEEGALNGALKELDPHASYLNTKNLTLLESDIKGEFGGIGIVLEKQSQNYYVKSVFPDSPAEKAGLLVNDQLIFNDDYSNIDNAVNSLRGEVGSTLKLTYLRNNVKKEVVIKRDKINVPSVKLTWLKPNVPMIKIDLFQKTTSKELGEILLKINLKETKGIVLDVRGNAGGLVTSVVDVVSYFLPEDKTIITTKGRANGENAVYETKNKDIFLNGFKTVPLVVLIDHQTASAAEILAGSLQDYKRATIIGNQSWGKGSVQSMIPLDKNTAIKFTTSLYYLPSGRALQGYGVKPDMPVFDENPNAMSERDFRNALPNPTMKKEPTDDLVGPLPTMAIRLNTLFKD